MNDKVCIVGLGYIGLPTAAFIASKKIHVLGLDVSETVVSTINSGKIHIKEKGLEKLVSDAVMGGYLTASLDPEEADVFIIAVPTPVEKQKNSIKPDLSYIIASMNMIAPVLKKGDLIILESTSPVGTTLELSKHLSKIRPDLAFPHNSKKADVSMAYCPERVLPGNILMELKNNNRVVGGVNKSSSIKAKEFYDSIIDGECTVTSCKTAEMVKLVENASRDVQIAFANEISIICDENDVDVWELISLANKHPRVNILQPGPGVGGHCIAVDPWFLISKSSNSQLMRSARKVNDFKPEWVLKQIKKKIKELSKAHRNVSVCIFGITFKPNVDDVRESPALQIARKLLTQDGISLSIVEPNLEHSNTDESFNFISFEEGLEHDILVLLVDHEEFKKAPMPKDKIIIDTKGIWL